MKITILFATALLINVYASAQNIGIGTETPEGKLHIKGGADTSQLIIDGNTTQSNEHPLVILRKSSGEELLRIHAATKTDVFIGYQAGLAALGTIALRNNTFIGSAAGSANSLGVGNTAIGSGAFARNTSGAQNVSIGYQSLANNTNGFYNTAVGTQALTSNTSGTQNTALGYNSLYSSSTGFNNTAIGWSALKTNTGLSNTALGAAAMQNNGAGSNNTSVGVNALFNNSGPDASYNTAIGIATLYNTTNAQYNTALGHNAGSQFDNGYNNVFLGANTDVNGAGYFNVIAIGQSTVCTASSQVTIGNGATNSYRAYASWSNISDGRFKKNIQENVPGLAFITQLRPVAYNLNASGLDAFLHPETSGDINPMARAAASPAKTVYAQALQQKEQVTQTGFVAQEVEATAKKMGFNFSGIDAPAGAGDVYGLRYAEFVVPLVKAIQEQQAIILHLQQQIDELKALIKK